MQVVILGWDALDAEVVEQYALAEQFGRPSKIETYVNPTIDAPHTRELWPSMISGQHPDEHGIYAVSDETGIEVTRDGDQGSITTDGQRRYVDFAPAGQGNKSGAVTTSELELSIPNNAVVTLAAQGVGGTASISGAITVQEFF